MKLFCLIFLLLSAAYSNAQSYYTKAGTIRFESKAPLEDIEAVNRTVTAVLKPGDAQLQFSVQMKGFEFRKALMQEHFNENYVESDKFPRASFAGSIIHPKNFNINNGSNVRVKGKLTMHGVTREIEADGEVVKEGDKIRLQSTFPVKLSDYKISIPSLVKDKVSNTVTVYVDCVLQPLK